MRYGNIQRTRTITKSMFEQGYSAVAIWQLCIKEIGSGLSYPAFMNILYGRHRHPEVEEWIINKGFGEELKAEQEYHKKMVEEANVRMIKKIQDKIKKSKKRGGDNIAR